MTKPSVERLKRPEYQDEVKHLFSDVTGTVIAVYTVKGPNGAVYFDVRGDDGRIFYHTHRDGWSVIRTREEKEGM